MTIPTSRRGPRSDQVQSFHLEGTQVRGVIASISGAWQHLLGNTHYPAPIMQWLGQALAASSLFAGDIRMAGGVSIQLRGEHQVRTIFAECSATGLVRGIAQYQAEQGLPQHLDELGENALLAITIEPIHGGERQQSLVPLEGNSLSQAFEAYFSRSEQLPTVIRLTANAQQCAGMMLQQLPTQGGRPPSKQQSDFEKFSILFNTLRDDELLNLDNHTLLRRLFSENDIRLHDANPLKFGCRCSYERVAQMLLMLGKEQALALADNQGAVPVRCEFCGKTYALDVVEIERLYHHREVSPPSSHREQ